MSRAKRRLMLKKGGVGRDQSFRAAASHGLGMAALKAALENKQSKGTTK